MDVFSFSISTVIAFLGLLLGSVLAHTAPDETHQFKHYLPFLQLLIFVLVFVLLFVYFPFFVALALFMLSFAFIFIFWHKKSLNLLDYIVLGALFALTSLVLQMHWYMTFLVFLFGVFTGALYYALHTKAHNKKHQKKKIAFHKHSGRHLSFGVISQSLLHDYVFFVIIAFLTYFSANIFRLLFF
jgi:hypothetical protein